MNFYEKVEKTFRFKFGDWVCLYSLNYNFSFRSCCCVCKKTKEDSDKIYNTFEFTKIKIK